MNCTLCDTEVTDDNDSDAIECDIIGPVCEECRPAHVRDCGPCFDDTFDYDILRPGK